MTTKTPIVNPEDVVGDGTPISAPKSTAPAPPAQEPSLPLFVTKPNDVPKKVGGVAYIDLRTDNGAKICITTYDNTVLESIVSIKEAVEFARTNYGWYPVPVYPVVQKAAQPTGQPNTGPGQTPPPAQGNPAKSPALPPQGVSANPVPPPAQQKSASPVPPPAQGLPQGQPTGKKIPDEGEVGIPIQAAKMFVVRRPDEKLELRFRMAGHQFDDIFAIRTDGNALALLQAANPGWTMEGMLSLLKFPKGVDVKYRIEYVYGKFNSEGNRYKNITLITELA